MGSVPQYELYKKLKLHEIIPESDPKYLYFFYLAKLNKKIQHSIAGWAKYSYFS
jgi:hypothetical protein